MPHRNEPMHPILGLLGGIAFLTFITATLVAADYLGQEFGRYLELDKIKDIPLPFVDYKIQGDEVMGISFAVVTGALLTKTGFPKY